MPQDDREKLDRIEEMKSKLFSKSYQTKIEHRGDFTHLPNKEVPESWAKEADKTNFQEKLFKKTSMFKKFFVFSIIFFILTAGYASYIYFVKGNTVSSSNIDISILGNTFTAGGEELSIQVEIINRNNSALELVDLIIEYPKSSSDSSSQSNERLRQSLGTIPIGGVISESFKVVLFGEQGSIRQIRTSIEYRVQGSNAIFVKEKIFEVSINSTPINLSVNAPSEISSNQEFVLDVKATLNATKVASQILIKIDYPLGFEFVSSKPAPSFGNNVWDLGDIPPGADRNISVIGKMIDVFDGEEKIFRVWSGSQSVVDKALIGVVFNSMAQTIAIKKPFIEAKLYVNGAYQREYAVGTKSPVSGEIRFVNNLDTKINDLEIRAKILGNAVDRKTIKSQQGTYDSLNNVIIWNQSSLEGFREVNPGESGSVSFSIFPLTSFSGLDGLLLEPSMNIEISISGKQPLEGNEIKNINNGETKIIRIISDMGLATKALYYSGAFKNTGAIPPKAEEETTYTVVWAVSNTVNNISRARVVSSLPTFVRFIGPVSPISEDVTYNASTKEVVWNVGNIPRGTGITGSGREVSFQIGFTPSLSQLGTSPVIINDAILTGHDDFANVDVRVNKNSLNIRLSSDPFFPFSGDRVVE